MRHHRPTNPLSRPNRWNWEDPLTGAPYTYGAMIGELIGGLCVVAGLPALMWFASIVLSPGVSP